MFKMRLTQKKVNAALQALGFLSLLPNLKL